MLSLYLELSFQPNWVCIQTTLGRGGFWRAPDNLPASRLLLEDLQEKVMITTTILAAGEVLPRYKVNMIMLEMILAVAMDIVRWRRRDDLTDMIKMMMVIVTIPRSPHGGSSGWSEMCIPSVSATSAKFARQLLLSWGQHCLTTDWWWQFLHVEVTFNHAFNKEHDNLDGVVSFTNQIILVLLHSFVRRTQLKNAFYINIRKVTQQQWNIS